MTAPESQERLGASRDVPPGLAVPAVSDASFPARVAALLRSRPLSEAAFNADRQDWPGQVYDIPSFALAAIDTIIANPKTNMTALAGRFGKSRSWFEGVFRDACKEFGVVA